MKPELFFLVIIVFAIFIVAINARVSELERRAGPIEKIGFTPTASSGTTLA